MNVPASVRPPENASTCAAGPVSAKLMPDALTPAFLDSMPQLLRLSGNLLLALIVAGAMYAGYVVYKTKRDNAAAAMFITQAVTAIAAGWDSQELVKRAAPEWLSPTDLAGMPGVFSQLSRLGKLKVLRAPSGRVGNGPYPGTLISDVWAEYSVAGDFDAGPSSFHMVLKRIDDGWQIYGFEVTANALMRGK